MTRRDRDKKVCEKIVAIRKRTGGNINRCPTCTNHIDHPYRRQDAHGHYIEACIDASHFSASEAPTGYSAWFQKAANVEFRKSYLMWLESH